MAKKKNIWDAMENTSVKKEVKKSIENKTVPTTKKRGRPAVEKEKSVRLVVTDKGRNILKKIAAEKETTMMEAFEEIVTAEWNRMKK